MQEKESQEGLYLKGFNDAYKLAKYQPELLAKVQPSIDGKDEYGKGFLDGIKQFEKEKGQEKKPDQDRVNELKKVREKGKSKDIGKEI